MIVILVGKVSVQQLNNACPHVDIGQVVNTAQASWLSKRLRSAWTTHNVKQSWKTLKKISILDTNLPRKIKGIKVILKSSICKCMDLCDGLKIEERRRTKGLKILPDITRASVLNSNEKA